LTAQLHVTAEFTVNPSRLEPYRNLKFGIKWDGHLVAGVSRISALKRTTEVIEHREGAEPSTSRMSPGRTSYEPILLERGVSHDTEFEDWANLFDGRGSDAPDAPLANFRKDVTVEIYNEAGQLVLAYNIFRCWVSEYQVLLDTSASEDGVVFESIKLENEGWQRNLNAVEPPA
jgi:phage tail-like protein